MLGNFWTPQHPLWWKIWKIVQKLFLIAQKKRLDALNATQKTTTPKTPKPRDGHSIDCDCFSLNEYSFFVKSQT